MKVNFFKLTTYSLVFLLFTVNAYAQDFAIKGKVTDVESGETLPFANVFLTETTYGTTTNANGEFLLAVSRSGTYDLVVRFVGYETYTAKVNLNEERVIELNIGLKLGSTNLGSVTVSAKKDEKWRENMNEFRNTFLGLTLNARKCKILNEEVVDFIEVPSEGTLEAFATEPIIIENEALGYRIKYYLENFIINYKSGVSSYYGFTNFEEIDKGSKRKKRIWNQNREKAYKGSVMHFFSSLYNNTLDREGYLVQVAQDVDGFGRVMSSNAVDLTTVVRDGSNPKSKKLPFNNYLYITYMKETEGTDYANAKMGTLGNRHVSVSLKNAPPQRSWITMFEGEEGIEFERTGYVYNPVSFYSAGYWGFEKIADMVPINYRPEEEKAALNR